MNSNIYKYIYQNHRDIQNEQAKFVISSNSIVNEFFLNSIESEKKYLNTKIKIKGRFIGYDDLLEHVKLDQCLIIN